MKQILILILFTSISLFGQEKFTITPSDHFQKLSVEGVKFLFPVTKYRQYDWTLMVRSNKDKDTIYIYDDSKKQIIF
ncbi:MAG: hypothetical protein ACOCUT_02455, partial [bacterium]